MPRVPETSPLWSKSEQEIKQVVSSVRAGRDLTPSGWPDDASVAVALTFDVDSETVAIWNGQHSPSTFSRGEYGVRVGLPRILRLLTKHQVSATFYVPGMTAVLHPDVACQITDCGNHEVGLHGWIHESITELAREDEFQLTEQAFRFWADQLGHPPTGIRTPSWDFTSATIDIIQKLGLRYDSSLMADDRPYELLSYEKPTGIVELPVDWKLDDYMYFHIDYERGYRPYIKPADVLEIWRAEFDMALQEGTVFILTMHPQIIGHRSRIVIINELIEYMKDRGAWFATMDEIARYVQPL
ncbi:MAG: polysaccharide deacetylase [Candidatus Latescibacteria bacterium]|nr:polysaccharide deacetylase [Candidatus Latescibacterota bacterium]